MKKKNLIVIALIFVLLLATLGISVAVFSSLTNGNTNNTLAVGDLKFHYTEITGVGNGINLVDPLPISDSEGKVLNGEREYFEFSIESNTIKSDIEYEVVVEPTSKSTVSLEGIKFYLTEVVNNNEQEIEYSIGENNKVKTLSEYNETEIENVSGRTVYSETIANNTRNYYKKFRARIWLSEDIDWTDEGYIGKTGSFKINVYAKGKVTPKQLTLKETVLYESNGGDSLVELPDSSFTRVSNEDENGLFKSTKTNTGRTTYYFRGNVDNNWVSFAGKLWRIVRVNEDGTVRLIMQDGINDNTTYKFNTEAVPLEKMYYSNSDTAKTTLNSWYTANITNEGYNYYVAKGNYYCEQAKVAWTNSYITGNSANMQLYSSYNPNYQCSDDYYGHGLINSNIGLISYDEVLMAGGYYNTSSNLYLKNNQNYWTISTAGYQNVQDNERFNIWRVRNNGILEPEFPSSNYNTLRPVINIKANVKVIDGTGTQTDPYIIGTTRVYESNESVIASLSNDTGNVIMCDGLKGKLSNCNKYSDLSTAIASRNKGTIILVNDVTTSEPVTIPIEKQIILELNGKSLAGNNSFDVIVNRGILTINNNSNTQGKILAYTESGSHATIRNYGDLTINNSNTYIEGPYGVAVSSADAITTINNVSVKATRYAAVQNNQGADITINNGNYESVGVTVNNASTGTININGGIFKSNNITIHNSSSGRINITQTDKPIYMTSLANAWAPVIRNSTGTINIKAKQANACTNNVSDTTSGLCVYAEGDRDWSNVTANAAVANYGGSVTINGGTYFGGTQSINLASTGTGINNIKNAQILSKKYAIVNNNNNGVVNICNSTVQGETGYDLSNQSGSTGTINYTSDVIFSSGTNTPNQNNPNGTITQVNKCPF